MRIVAASILGLALVGCGGKVVIDTSETNADALPPNAIAIPYDTPAALPADLLWNDAPSAYPPDTLLILASNEPEICGTPLPEGFGASSCDGAWQWTFWLILPPAQQKVGKFPLNTTSAFTNVKDCNGVASSGTGGELTIKSLDEATIVATMSGMGSGSSFDMNETIVARRCP